ncbi:MAG: PQQ-binding-like beta-propeller repeat protein [Planctomycetaceae bacterium]|nr:PQQ-binding-like beta-propeller repeat protein [Planctomycetaceae bacterium]
MLILTGTSTAFPQENWTRFRGPNGTGISHLKGVPTEFSETDFAWNLELPGKGHGSPIIWEDQLFVTSATETGEQDGGEQRLLFCLNPATGQEIWSLKLGFNTSHKHVKNSFASSTPCTDGELLYVAFADEQKLTLDAYTLDGELKWRRILGAFTSQHGFGVSPIIYKNLVILPKDMMGTSRIMAFDKKTGDTVWSIPREIRRTSYATPMILERPGQDDQLITVSGASGITGHDPLTGDVLWTTAEFPKRTVASPILAGDYIIATDGGGGKGFDLWAVSPDGSGDITETHIKYKRTKELPYVPTPIYFNDLLFLWSDKGVVSCVDPKTGENFWTERVQRTEVSSSPVCIDGKIYCPDENGNVAVIAASKEFKHFGTSPLGEPTHATPAVAAGRVFFRTFNRLMCLEAAK